MLTCVVFPCPATNPGKKRQVGATLQGWLVVFQTDTTSTMSWSGPSDRKPMVIWGTGQVPTVFPWGCLIETPVHPTGYNMLKLPFPPDVSEHAKRDTSSWCT